MKDTCKSLRKVVYDATNTFVVYKSLPVPVVDEKVFTGQIPDLYILLGRQTETDISDDDCTYKTRSTIEVWIISKTGSEVSKDVIDDISQQILDLLIPLPPFDNFVQPAGLEIEYLRRQSSVEGQVQITPTQSELQKVITLTANIIQLN